MSHTRLFAYEANEGYSGVFGQLMVWCIKENILELCLLGSQYLVSLPHCVL